MRRRRSATWPAQTRRTSAGGKRRCAAVKQAEGLAGADAEALRQLAALRVEAQAGADAADRDRALLEQLVDIRSAKADDDDGSQTDAAYAGAFHDAGLDLSAVPSAEAGAKIRARPPGVALVLAAALDQWSAVRRKNRNDPTGASRLAEVARLADRDPWRDNLRAALALADKDGRKAALQALASTAKFDELGAISLDLLGNALADAGDPATAERVLRRAQARHTGDVWINYDLARVLERLNRRADAIRFYTAARALRPETAHELAHALAGRGESDEAIEVFRDLARLRPKMGRHLGCLATELIGRGRSKEAAAALEQAVAAHREAIRLKPDDAIAHNNLGLALDEQGKLDEAVAEYREAIRLKPDDAIAHDNLGIALADAGEARRGRRRMPRGDPAQARLRRRPQQPRHRPGRPGEARRGRRRIPRGDPAQARRRHGPQQPRRRPAGPGEARRGRRRIPRGDPAQARLRRWPTATSASPCMAQGKLDEAVAAYREAIRLKPDDA